MSRIKGGGIKGDMNGSINGSMKSRSVWDMSHFSSTLLVNSKNACEAPLWGCEREWDKK